MKRQRDAKAGLTRILSNNLFLIGIAFKAAPYFTIQRLSLTSRSRFVIFIEHVYMIGFIINTIDAGRPFTDVGIFITAMFVFVALMNLWCIFDVTKVDPIATQKIEERIRMALYSKASTMDLACYDDPAFYNDFVWAMGEATTRVYQVLDTTANIIGDIFNILLVGGYVLLYDGITPIFVGISFIGIFLTAKQQNKVQLDLNNRMRPAQRKRDYISRVLYLADHAKEIRLNNIKPLLYAQFDQAADTLDREAHKGTWPLTIYHFLTRTVFNTFIMDGMYLMYLLYRTIVQGALEFGTMVALYNSSNRLKQSFLILSRSIPQLQEHSLYIEKIRHFLDYENKVRDPAQPVPLPAATAGLKLQNISFSYGDTPVLKDINLTVQPGEKIALVGYNGAGKTTLVKLLMRLYNPQAGAILYGGADIQKFAVADYRSLFETVFQDYQLFAATVGQNIVMADAPLNEAHVKAAAEWGGFINKLDSLEKGYDTQVTREFDNDGVLLSGGEAQSLAITRALYKDSPIIILDEPSSALDPLAEYHLNKTMLELDKSKTVITISHRLSTTRMADKIYMLEKGRIIESGTHDELMLQNGKYAMMFRFQAEKYHAVNESIQTGA